MLQFKKTNILNLMESDDIGKIPTDDYHKFKTESGEINLNDEQYVVVTADKNEKIRILACAGSGKTTTIVCRIKYLVDQGVSPNKIILTTFNVDAAESMRKRLECVFGYMPKILVGTIDSISCKFYNMYFKKSEYIGVSEYSTELSKYLNTPDSVKITSRYEYLFFDEFQDCNDVQFNILRQFDKAGCVVTVIGDDAQNIYQWRGSNIDFILNYEKYIDGVTTYKLVRNYRSTPELVTFANASIAKNKDQIPKDMLPTKHSIGIAPKIIKYVSEQYQAKEIIKKIIYYRALGVNFDNIAIIARINYPLKYVEEELEKYNKENSKIPYIALITDDMKDTKPKICKDHVCLTTIHKAKGLEWDVVFLITCNDERFPTEIDASAIEEERRLFYVAITRAKRFLEISFTGQNVTRFVSEHPLSMFNFVDFKLKYLELVNNRETKFKIGVTELIDMLEQKDIETMRTSGILPSLRPITETVHGNHIYSDTIAKYYLQTDFGIYIDRYISRGFGLLNEMSGGLTDCVASRVINSIVLSSSEFPIYSKYNINISKKFTTGMFIHDIDTIITYINRNLDDPDYIKIIEDKDKIKLRSIIQKIIDLCGKLDLTPAQVFVVSKSYLPSEFLKSMNESYKKFNNKEIDNGADNLQNIYNVSICQNIYDGRRRLLYKDVFDVFNSDVSLYNDIDTWISKFKDDEIQVKLTLDHKSLSVCGELDMYNATNCTVVDFKVSVVSECKLDWIIQLLAYTALLRIVKNCEVFYIQIYNPMTGTVTTFDVSDWNKEIELLTFLSDVRNAKLQRTKNATIVKKPYQKCYDR
jgi:hypothetical protein